jgi:hypothetical protein
VALPWVLPRSCLADAPRKRGRRPPAGALVQRPSGAAEVRRDRSLAKRPARPRRTLRSRPSSRRLRPLPAAHRPPRPQTKGDPSCRSGLARSRRTQSIGARLLDAASCLRPTGRWRVATCENRLETEHHVDLAHPAEPETVAPCRIDQAIAAGRRRGGRLRHPRLPPAPAKHYRPRPLAQTTLGTPTVDRRGGVGSMARPGAGPVAAQRPWPGGGCWAVPRVA